MSFSKTALPASLRKQVESFRTPGSKTPAMEVPVADGRLRGAVKTEIASLKARFVRLPQEPEDAKLTGDTRSLDRRLLGLNLRGSLGRRVRGLTA